MRWDSPTTSSGAPGHPKKAFMASVDYKILPLRRPETLKFSLEVGGEMARMLGDLLMPTRCSDEDAVLLEVGKQVGEQTY